VIGIYGKTKVKNKIYIPQDLFIRDYEIDINYNENKFLNYWNMYCLFNKQDRNYNIPNKRK